MWVELENTRRPLRCSCQNPWNKRVQLEVRQLRGTGSSANQHAQAGNRWSLVIVNRRSQTTTAAIHNRAATSQQALLKVEKCYQEASPDVELHAGMT